MDMQERFNYLRIHSDYYTSDFIYASDSDFIYATLWCSYHAYFIMILFMLVTLILFNATLWCSYHAYFIMMILLLCL